MKIMVFDVAAESGGALSVLNDFYDEYKKDKEKRYIFVVSKPELKDSKNVKVLRYPWVKKSWLHRFYFDNIIAPKLIREYAADEVLSLQNIIIPHTKAKQVVYVHNSLPFSEYRFSFFEDKILWIYQNILSRRIFKSIKKASRVIVQTVWMKKMCVNKLNVDASKIDVQLPNIDIKVKKRYVESVESISTFFYPANGMIYKNHKIIVDACIRLKEQGINNYNVVFTLYGNENKHISKLYRIVEEKGLPIKFIGNISREEVFEFYSKSILLFPSYIETVGLPLIEARMHGTPIVASDCAYAHEILDGYNKVEYFNPLDIMNLANTIKRKLTSSNIMILK